MKKTAYINGKSYYSMTTKRNTKGKFPSNCFEVGVTNIDYTDDNNELLQKYVKTARDETEFLAIKNAKFEIPMFDMNNNRLPNAVAIPNGTDITLYVEEQHNDNYDTDYLVCKAIRVNEEVKEFNPFN